MRMTSRLGLACVVAGLAVTGAAAGTGGGAAVPGVAATSIRLGGTFPLTGEASDAAAIARGARAYFRYVNAHGGIYHRRIVFLYRDDGFDPARAVAATRRLVNGDKVFAIFGSYGTEENLATRPLLNQLGVPQLFVASGATEPAADVPAYPWTVGFPPSFATEGALLARDVLKRPSPRIAVLYENDDFGLGLLDAFRRGLGARQSAIVAVQPYDPTVPDLRAQMLQLKASGATTFVNFAFGRFAIEAYTDAAQFGWRPRTYISSAAGSSALLKIATHTAGPAATDGTISIAFVKDPDSATIAADLGFQLFKSILRAYDRGVSTNDAYAMYGMAAAYAMVDALRRAGKRLTRAGVLRAATRLDERANPFVLPGIVVRTGPRDRFPIAQATLQRWQDGRWVQFGPLLRG
jgi:branched-chain amino acid transport system substrate-binding protein